jgi:hypothetical protein
VRQPTLKLLEQDVERRQAQVIPLEPIGVPLSLSELQNDVGVGSRLDLESASLVVIVASHLMLK